MKPISDLITLPSGGSDEPTPPRQLNETHIAHLWECMTMYFGYHWTNSYGEADNGAWLTGLHDLAPEDILNGINSVRLSGREWPPSLPQFRAMCKPIVPPYFDIYPKLARPETNPSIAAEHIAKMQKIVKGK